MNRFLVYADCIINLRNVASVTIKNTVIKNKTYLEFKLNTGTAASGSVFAFLNDDSNKERIYFNTKEEAIKELDYIIALVNEKEK